MRRFSLSLVISLCIAFGGGCSKPAEAPPATKAGSAVLPPVALGNFKGMLGLTVGGTIKKGFGNAVCTVAATGDKYSLTFSGGMPEVDADVHALENISFVATPGSQVGVFESVAENGSIPGITISTYMTNINIDIPYGAGRLVYTGRK